MEKAYASPRSLFASAGRLRLRQLELLVAMARHPTLTKAAHELGVTQPHLSQVLADIETALGATLFGRGRRLQPTAALAPVLRYARLALAETSKLANELRMAADGWAGRVRLGAMTAASPILVPRAIALLRAAGSTVEIEVHEDIAAGLWPRLERDEVDIVVARLDHRSRAPDVVFEPLYDDPQCIAVGPEHPLFRGARPDLAAATRFPWIYPPAGTPLRLIVEQNLLSAGLALPRCYVETSSITLTLAIIGSTDCVLAVSTSTARYYAEAGRLRILPITLPQDLGAMGMAWRSAEPNLPLRRFQEALRSVSRTMPLPTDPWRTLDDAPSDLPGIAPQAGVRDEPDPALRGPS